MDRIWKRLLLTGGIIVAAAGASHSLGQPRPHVDCVLVEGPRIEIRATDGLPSRVAGRLTIRCSRGVRGHMVLAPAGVLGGPVEVAYVIDAQEVPFTGTGAPQTIVFTARLLPEVRALPPGEYVGQPTMLLAF